MEEEAIFIAYLIFDIDGTGLISIPSMLSIPLSSLRWSKSINGSLRIIQVHIANELWYLRPILLEGRTHHITLNVWDNFSCGCCWT